MKNTNSIYSKIRFIKRSKIEDHRGWFLKVITGTEEGLPNFTGEIYIVTSENGASRGGHYHDEANEWFTLLTGKATLALKDIDSGETLNLILDSNCPETILIPAKLAHRFDAIDENPFLLLAYTDRLFEPEDTIAINY